MLTNLTVLVRIVALLAVRHLLLAIKHEEALVSTSRPPTKNANLYDTFIVVHSSVYHNAILEVYYFISGILCYVPCRPA